MFRHRHFNFHLRCEVICSNGITLGNNDSMINNIRHIYHIKHFGKRNFTDRCRGYRRARNAACKFAITVKLNRIIFGVYGTGVFDADTHFKCASGSNLVRHRNTYGIEIRVIQFPYSNTVDRCGHIVFHSTLECKLDCLPGIIGQRHHHKIPPRGSQILHNKFLCKYKLTPVAHIDLELIKVVGIIPV